MTLTLIAGSEVASSSTSSSFLSPSTNSGPLTSLLQTVTSLSSGDTTFKVILILLMALLTANSILFYQMWNLETRISQTTDAKSPSSDFDHWKNFDPTLLLGEDDPHRTSEQWLALLRKQEAIHQMELEKWNEMLQVATELLRKVGFR